MTKREYVGKCPVCGHNPVYVSEAFYYDKNGNILPYNRYIVDCPHCHTETDLYKKMEDAILAWNEKRFHLYGKESFNTHEKSRAEDVRNVKRRINTCFRLWRDYQL